jgi:hypothetical protein
MLNSIGETIKVTDRTMTVVFVSYAMQKMGSLPRELVLGHNNIEFLLPVQQIGAILGSRPQK